jgi:hypothetical protein
MQLPTFDHFLTFKIAIYVKSIEFWKTEFLKYDFNIQVLEIKQHKTLDKIHVF